MRILMSKRFGGISLALGLLLWPLSVQAQDNTSRQCDAAAVVYCGAYTRDELSFKLDNGDGHNTAKDLQQILFNEKRGITKDTVRTVVDGDLTSDGHIVVAGRKIASGAQLAARDRPKGSTKDSSLYLRPVSTQLTGDDTLPVLVSVSDKGAFQWAMLKRSGDVVKAKAEAAATPTPTPKAPVIQPTTGGSGIDAPLPESGPADTASGVVGITALAMVFGYFIRSRRGLHHALRHHR